MRGAQKGKGDAHTRRRRGGCTQREGGCAHEEKGEGRGFQKEKEGQSLGGGRTQEERGCSHE